MNEAPTPQLKSYNLLPAILVFVAALGPRLYALDTFLTIDEVKWAEGAVQFLLALHSGDFFRTYWHFFPGITTSWVSAPILWGRCLSAPDLALCLNSHLENIDLSIGWFRLGPMLLTCLGIMGIYLWGRGLVDHSLALLTALLLAFDPFFIAHSRIINGDVIAAILMFLSLQAFLSYWLGEGAGRQSRAVAQPDPADRMFSARLAMKPRNLKWLILSAIMAGLAGLTKLPAPLIGLFIGGLGGLALLLDWPKEHWLAGRRWGLALAIWGGLALATFWVLWPAMWVAPLETLRLMYSEAFEVGGAGIGHDTFFMGKIVDDPGPWFYPYALAFRLTPLIMVGILAGLGWLFLHSLFSNAQAEMTGPKSIAPDSKLLIPWIMLVFVIFIIAFANLSPKKLDRYVMAVIPPLVFLAALGLTKLVSYGLRQVSSAWRVASQASGSGKLHVLALAGLALLQLIFALSAVPYYLTYYNPLLGGVKRAVTQTPVGWGEGLEQAAFYLNNLPQAESLNVSSWYGDIFQPYFVGGQASFSDDGRAQLAADYVVFYVNQIQRQKPYSGLLNYFRTQQPAFVMDVSQTDQPAGKELIHWVEVYQAPAAQSAGGAPEVEGVAQLLAYKIGGLANSEIASRKIAGNAADLQAGQALPITLFFRILGPLPPETTFKAALKPVASTQQVMWGDWRSTGVNGEWVAGEIVEWRGVLRLPAAMPPGEYRFWVALQFETGPVIRELPISDNDPLITVQE